MASDPAATKTEVSEEKVNQAHMVLKGHTGAVWGVAIMPDGKTVVSCSGDHTLKVWDLKTGECRATLSGHKHIVRCVAITPDGETIVSGSEDYTLKVWDINTGECRATFSGHTLGVWGIAISPDGKTVVSGSWDKTLKVWDLETGECRLTLRGHADLIYGVAISSDGKTIISGSMDTTLRIWDLATGKWRGIMIGHMGAVYRIAFTPNGKTIVSSSQDSTLKIWNFKPPNLCRAIFEGHTGQVYPVVISPDGKTVISGSWDKTLKLWDLETGKCLLTLTGHTDFVYGLAISPDGKTVISASKDLTLRVWDLPKLDTIERAEAICYINAKVVLVGNTGVGKSGLAMRLCENRWEPTESTHGMIISQLKLAPDQGPSSMEREVWLWDFAGQSDYHLIHQLYMDETALGVLVFNPQDDNPFDDIGYWVNALRATTKHELPKLLVAARCDRGGITISRRRFEQYVNEHGFAGFLCTGAKTGEGCEELKAAIAQHIPWERLPWTATSQLFKTFKNAILSLTEEGTTLIRLSELHKRFQLLLPTFTINEADIRAVVGLMQVQGVVQMLSFGDYILLQPEWINRYASVIVRMAREHVDEMGVVPEQIVLDGQLDYKDMNRLDEADEKILLRAIVQTFLDRSLCIREETGHGTFLVFPYYFRRDKPDLPEHPNVFVTYGFAGPLEEIYSTLVVKLSYSDWFKCDQLWKNAADFKTPAGKRVGLAMIRKAEGAAEIVVYFEAGVPDDSKVTFIKYVHEHLLAKAKPQESVTRLRTYICPYCDEPLEIRRAIQIRLSKGLKDVGCPVCENRVPLIDLIEEKFASDEVLQRVREMEEKAKINLDNESRELILIGHAMAIAGEAGQIYRIVAEPDWGIDAEIEFKNNKGEASGQRVYLQLKSGDSYLYRRRRDDQDVFEIKNPRHAEYWLSQAYPVMLVIRTSDGNIRWMNVTDYLRKHGIETKQITFEGEPFTAANIAKLRDSVLQLRENESVR